MSKTIYIHTGVAVDNMLSYLREESAAKDIALKGKDRMIARRGRIIRVLCSEIRRLRRTRRGAQSRR